jgi:hypothetical protein
MRKSDGCMPNFPDFADYSEWAVIHSGKFNFLQFQVRGKKDTRFQGVKRDKSDQTGGYTGLSGRPIQTKRAAGSDRRGGTAGGRDLSAKR